MPQTILLISGFVKTEEEPRSEYIALYNNDILIITAQLICYPVAVYGYNSGHFTSLNGSPLFEVVLYACVSPCGHVLFKQSSNILSS